MADLARLISAAIKNDGFSGLDPYQSAYFAAHARRDPEAFRQLAKIAVASLPTGVHSFRGIEKLVRIHFGQSISMVSVRTDLRCRNDQVKDYRVAVFRRMAEIRASLKITLEKLPESR